MCLHPSDLMYYQDEITTLLDVMTKDTTNVLKCDSFSVFKTIQEMTSVTYILHSQEVGG